MKANELKKRIANLLNVAKKAKIMDCQNIKVDGDIFTANDLSIQIEEEVRFVNLSDEPYLIPAFQLDKVLSKLKNSEVRLNYVKGKAVIETEKGEFTLGSDDLKEFPDTFKYSELISRTLFTETRTLSKAFNFTSKDELRPAMCGVLVGPNVICATNGHYMLWSTNDTGLKERFIIPNFVGTHIKGVGQIVVKTYKSELRTSNYIIQFEYNNTKLTFRDIDERFPNYDCVIPTKNHNKFWIDKKEFLPELHLAEVAANSRTQKVVLRACRTLFAQDIDLQTEYNTKLNCELSTDTDIAFNGQFMQLIVNNLDESTVKMEYSAHNRAMIIKDANNVNFLLMPTALYDWE